MAQRRGGTARRLSAMARRLGLAGNAVPVAAFLVVASLVGGVAWAFAGTDQGVVLERGEEALPQSVDEPDEDAQAGDTQVELPVAVVVHVDGAVAAPGVYVLDMADPRVNDAVGCAGGLTAEADTSSINLAMPVADGQKVHVPAMGEDPLPEAQTQPQAATQTGPVGGSATATGLVNINLASVEELQSLSGIGAITASAIVEDRELNGPFSCAEDLMRVSGIGQKKFEKIQHDICV